MFHERFLGPGVKDISRGNSICSAATFRAAGNGIRSWKTGRSCVDTAICGRFCVLDQVMCMACRRITGGVFGRSMINASLSEQQTKNVNL